MRTSFQTKLLLAALSSATLALAVAGVLVSLAMQRQNDAQTTRALVAEARLAADLLGRPGTPVHAAARPSIVDLDAEADRMGALLEARVTFIAADGRVMGDSSEPVAALPEVENHGSRPEVVSARATGLGTARRTSATVNVEFLYVAVPVTHPSIAVVRLALPLTSVRQQARDIVLAIVLALGIAFAGASAMAIVVARRMGRRVQAIAAIAARYRAGDLTPPRLHYGDDELGAVARTLDQSVQDLGGRMAELARDRGRMAAILAGMIEGVIVVDAQGRLELVNRAAEDMLKLSAPQPGRHYLEAIRHPRIADLVAAALAGHQPDAVELAPPRDPSRTVIAGATATGDGGVHGVVLVLHDVTELKRTDRIRRDFVANVSHELRTPLTAIRGYMEALSEGDTSPDEARRFLDVIARHALRMERLVKDLLRLARLDAGQERLEIAPCDVRGLAEAVAADLAPTLSARTQHVEIVVAPGAESVEGDPVKLHDVLRNLIANASAYAPEHTTIRIEARLEGEAIAIGVLDEGPGIPEEDLVRVFERFYRVDKSRARDPGGTGLGLAIVKHLVELHGGHVRVRNREGGGAQFTVTLKAYRAPNMASTR